MSDSGSGLFLSGTYIISASGSLPLLAGTGDRAERADLFEKEPPGVLTVTLPWLGIAVDSAVALQLPLSIASRLDDAVLPFPRPLPSVNCRMDLLEEVVLPFPRALPSVNSRRELLEETELMVKCP